jgi:hypothetical protein
VMALVLRVLSNSALKWAAEIAFSLSLSLSCGIVRAALSAAG